MSSSILPELNNSLCTQSVIHFGVKTGRERLRDHLREKMGDTMSTHDVARRAKAAGFTLSNGTVGNILNLYVKDIKEDTLRALARVFNEPPDEWFRLYYGTTQDGLAEQEQRAVNYMRGLPEEKQADVILYLKMLYEKYSERENGADKETAARPAGTTSAKKARRAGGRSQKQRA